MTPPPATRIPATSTTSPTSTTSVVVLSVLTVLTGGVGFVLVGLVVLFRMSAPRTRAAQAWRLAALTAGTTGVVAGLVGGVVGLYLGRVHPPTMPFAFVEGGLIAAVPALLVGAVVGAVVALDHLHQTPHPGAPLG